MLVILTGGIAAGKSWIARRFAQLGAVVFDADIFARDAVKPGTPALAALVQQFGEEMVDASGALRREALAQRVFQDPDALAVLNEIVHPAVREIAQAAISAAQQKNPHEIIVYEVPLYVESKTQPHADCVVTAEASNEIRVQRMVQLRGMSSEAAQQRISHQADEEQRRSIADVVIDTSGSETQTQQQVDALWHRLQHGTFFAKCGDGAHQ